MGEGPPMFIDMHTHSVSSDDSRATVEQYVRWVDNLRRRGHRIDGFVLTEHRKFDREADYSSLAQEHGILILKGSEVETRWGHFLVYGVTEELIRRVDFSDTALDPADLVQEARRCGAIAIPAHPGRFGIGLYELKGTGADLSEVRIVELLNGSNRPGEQERAEELARQYGYLGIGGSDAHFVSAIGTCLTQFDDSIASEQDLVRQLNSGRFRAVRLQDTKNISETRWTPPNTVQNT